MNSNPMSSMDLTVEGEVLVITRHLHAPVQRVYDAWTKADQLARWFAPNRRWKSITAETDVRPGGKYRIDMYHQDGDVYTLIGKYIEVLPCRRLQFSFNWLQGMSGQYESIVTLDFAGYADETELRIKHVNLTAVELAETRKGWAGCLDMLETLMVTNESPF